MVHVCLCIVILYIYIIYIYIYIYIYIFFSSVCLTGGLAANPGIYCCDKWYMSREYCCSCTSLWSLESLCGVCLLVGLWFCFWQHWKGVCPFFSLTVTIFSLLWPFLHLGLSFFLDDMFSIGSWMCFGWTVFFCILLYHWMRKAGSIVNTASCAGLGCPTSMPAYGTSTGLRSNMLQDDERYFLTFI